MKQYEIKVIDIYIQISSAAADLDVIHRHVQNLDVLVLASGVIRRIVII